MADPLTSLREELQGRYAVERELGRGGMATVYLARDVRHKRPVALKVLHPELAAGLGPGRFEREIEFAARLQHPHILTVLDSGSAKPPSGPDILWFAMPYVEGESLRGRLRRERQLPVEDALRIAGETARALDYAHRQGVVHRDIKPENILLTRDGDTLVADFGIARALAAGAGEERLTETGLAVGTPAYMSPEQAAGDRGVDARTDVYALGAVLYEMLAGEPPFSGATVQALMAKRLTEPPPSVRAVRPNVPVAVDDAIRKALAPVAADRFGSVAQLAQALQAPRVATGATEAPTAATAPAGPPPRPRPFAAMALVLGIFIGLGVLFAWGRTADKSGDAGDARVIAVLPFENLGDSGDAYFADGVSDEVRTKLAQVGGLEVIARGSSVEYRGTDKRPVEVARELGADYLLTGTVRWEKTAGATSRVRVTPELVEIRRGESARTRWGQQFDAALTNVFQVQGEIATKVADALGVALADSVRAGLAERPTASLEAYDAFLRAEALTSGMSTSSPTILQRALPHYQRAVELDPGFVPAWAQLARAYAGLYLGLVPTPELAARAREAAERASRLGPDRPEGYVALGGYYIRVLRDAARALAIYEAGLKLAPNNVDLIGAIGSLEQTRGNWEAAVAHMRRALTLDPRSAGVARRLALALLSMRLYSEAEPAQARASALGPTDPSNVHQTAMLALAQGRRDVAERIARNPPPGVPALDMAVYFARFEELGWLLDDEQRSLILASGPEAFEGDRGSRSFVLAQLHAIAGRSEAARAYGDSAASVYMEVLKNAPDDAQVRGLYAAAMAYAGRYPEAVRMADQAVESPYVRENAFLGPYVVGLAARVHMLAGNHDRAVTLLERATSVPNTMSRDWLRVDPTWEPLRGHAGFQRLVNPS